MLVLPVTHSTPGVQEECRVNVGRAKSFVSNLKLTLLQLLLDHKTSRSIDLSKPQKILFDQKDNLIGDMLVNTVAFRAIKQSRPDWSTHVLAGSTNREAIRFNRFVDQIHVFDGTWTALRQLRQHGLDIYFCNKNRLHWRDFMLLRYAGARINIGRNKDAYKLFDYSIKVCGETELDRYLALLRFLGISTNSCQYDLPLAPGELSRARDFLARRSGRPIIAFNRYGNKRGKLFSRAVAVRLLTEINRCYPDALIVLLCSPQSKAETVYLRQQLDSSKVCVAEHTQTIRDAAALIHCADFVVTPDTSIVHIACAFDTAQICVYRDQNELRLWRPLSDKAVTLLPRPPSRHVNDLDITEFRDSLAKIGQFIAS